MYRQARGLAGAAEFAGRPAAPERARADLKRALARRLLPDFLPAIGPSPVDRRLSHAFGRQTWDSSGCSWSRFGLSSGRQPLPS